MRWLKRRSAGRTLAAATICKVEAVLRTRHATDWQLESFSYLAMRSPQAEPWHSGLVQWARDEVKEHHSLRRKAVARERRRGEQAARGAQQAAAHATAGGTQRSLLAGCACHMRDICCTGHMRICQLRHIRGHMPAPN